MEDLISVTGKQMLRPPVRDSCPTRDCDLLVYSRTRIHDILTPRTRLEGKVPYGDPNASTRREKSLTKSPLRKDDGRDSVGWMTVRSPESRSHGRSFTSTFKSSTREDHIASVLSHLDKSSTLERQRSSSRHSRLSVEHAGSSESVAPRRTNTSFSRRHSTEALSFKSFNRTFSRRGSAPELCSNIKRINRGEDSDVGNGKGALTAMKRNGSKHSLNSMSGATKSMTSSEGNNGTGSGRSFLRPSQREGITPTSKHRSKHAEEKSVYPRGRSKSTEKSIFSRGRSMSKAHRKMSMGEQTGKTVILLTRKSFSNSLTRRRSLSRNASRVLKTTSTMDGNMDAEPCMHRYYE